MKKFTKVLFQASLRVISLAILSIPVLLLIYKQPWMIDRLLASFVSFYQKSRSVVLFYMGEDVLAPRMLDSLDLIDDYPNIISTLNFDAFWKDILVYFKILISKNNGLSWLIEVSYKMMDFTRFLMVLFLVIMMLVCLGLSYFNESGKNWREESIFRKKVRSFEEGPLLAIKKYFLKFWEFYKKSPYPWITLVIILFDLGLPMIALDFISEYFYFFTSFELASLVDTLLTGVITFLAGFLTIPAPIRIVVIYAVFRFLSFWHARKLIEGKLIPADEAMVNNDTGVFTLILGKMRGGKTTLGTAMGRIVNTVFHKNAYDNMNRCSMMFPDFPWIALEKDIIRLASRRRLVNMEQCAGFTYRLYENGRSMPLILYGYDLQRERYHFIDGATDISLRDAMAIYAESYWVYFHKGNLISSNYPIRTDDIRLDHGHLVIYDSNYFHRKVKDMWSISSLSHILVFDMLRFGKKKDENNPYRDAAGPMIGVATEFGKEQGNMISNNVYSQKDIEANPKNDLLDYSLKLGGHLANIWHTNFFKFIADEQRCGSLSSNLVNVAQSIFTADQSNQEEKMAVKLFWIESLILDGLITFRDWFYKKYRYNREDNTLLFTIINRIGSWAYAIETRIFMRYGYKEIKLPSCTADSAGNLLEGEIKKFYIINFVDYSSRFESACMKDFLNAKKSEASIGFFDTPTYKGLMPNKQEWDMQGSYLVGDLENPKKKFSPPRASWLRNGSRRPMGADHSGPRRGEERR